MLSSAVKCIRSLIRRQIVFLNMEPTPSIQSFDLDDDETFAKTVAAMRRVDAAEAEEEEQEARLEEEDEFAGLSKREAKKLRLKKRKGITRELRKERIKRRKEQEQSETGIVSLKALEETKFKFSDGTITFIQILRSRSIFPQVCSLRKRIYCLYHVNRLFYRRQRRSIARFIFPRRATGGVLC
jgi:hypothetical protein